ncbi:MAG: hypothetical protein HYT77_07860 [Deltaproteobacteria bacterium]|nr:hypothetical protein [Deltaproteobacteria bacterium]
MRKDNKTSRRVHIAPQIVFADGISGSGKTALSAVLQSLERVEVQRIDPIYEEICVMRFLDRIEEDAAVTLIRIQSDLSCHDMMISRGANFRCSDLSSVIARREEYERRLTLPDGPPVLERIRQERPILHLMTHQTIGISHPLFEAVGDRGVLIEMVRHPLFVLTAWLDYISRYGTDPLELDICLDYKGQDLPWFALGWEEIFLESNRMDRIIRSLDFLTTRRNLFLKSQPQNARLLCIPFEKFVQEPWPFIEKIETLLGTKRTDRTEKVLQEQKIPRKVLTDVPSLHALQRYGWRPLKNGETTNEAEVQRQWGLVKKEASMEAVRIFEQICSHYEREYGISPPPPSPYLRGGLREGI